ncbi:MAG: substrate-binding domain-containing protein [Beijerinckiaceae bacterium]
MQTKTYLNTEEAADYLHIKERKLYELVANGGVPCSKVTGKWLFPRTALDRWIEAGLTMPAGVSAQDAPPIMGGSHDPLLEWAVRQSGSGLAMLPEGSEAGLERLAKYEVCAAAVHLHSGSDDDDQANIIGLMQSHALHDGVLVHCVKREQGLLVAPGNPLALRDVRHARESKARFGLRQKGAGAQLLLERLITRDGGSVTDVMAGISPFATGQDLAMAIRNRDVDCGVATRSVAATHGLDFLPLGWEYFDLAMRRRSYFEPGMQALLHLMRSEDFQRQARHFSGYDCRETGSIRLNR